MERGDLWLSSRIWAKHMTVWSWVFSEARCASFAFQGVSQTCLWIVLVALGSTFFLFFIFYKWMDLLKVELFHLPSLFALWLMSFVKSRRRETSFGHAMCKRRALVHHLFFFADDSVLFCPARVDESENKLKKFSIFMRWLQGNRWICRNWSHLLALNWKMY